MTGSARRPRSAWSVFVPVVALLAGLLFATSRQTAQGTDLRGGDGAQLSGLLRERTQAAGRLEEELARLQAQVDQLTEEAARRNGAVARAQTDAEGGAVSAGLVELRGTGLEITLDDAPRRADGSLPVGARADDVVIHQSDVQAVVNALWAAGADGVAVMGRRLIATSAVRCVGNVLLLQGRTYSPPFVVTAIGDTAAMQGQLDASPGVGIFEQAVDDFGLTFRVREREDVVLPAYDGTLDLQYATAQ